MHYEQDVGDHYALPGTFRRFQEIPARYRNAVISPKSREGWRDELYELVADYLKGYKEHVPKGIAPVLVGVSNAGKTHAAAAITNYLKKAAIKHQDDPFWVDFTERGFVWAQANDLFATLTSLQDFRKDVFWRLDTALRTAPWLVLDDISHLRDFERHQEMFWLYLDHRYTQNLATLITANFDLSDGIEVLDEILGEPLRRRIKAMAGDFMILLTDEKS